MIWSENIQWVIYKKVHIHITKGIKNLQYLNFHDCTINTLHNSFHKQTSSGSTFWGKHIRWNHSTHMSQWIHLSSILLLHFLVSLKDWIFRLADFAFVTKIFSVRWTIAITFVTATLICIIPIASGFVWTSNQEFFMVIFEGVDWILLEWSSPRFALLLSLLC